MSGSINIRTLPAGTSITLADGAVADITTNPADGVWLFARITAAADANRIGEEEMVFAQDVITVQEPP